MGFVAVTIHHFVKGMILKSLSLGVKRIYGSHTAENLAEAIKSMCDEYNIFHKVVTITGDNGGNMRGAAGVLKILYVCCFAHVLNRVLVTILANLKISLENGDGSQIIQKCRKVVTTFNQSIQLTEKLNDDQ